MESELFLEWADYSPGKNIAVQLAHKRLTTSLKVRPGTFRVMSVFAHSNSTLYDHNTGNFRFCLCISAQSLPIHAVILSIQVKLTWAGVWLNNHTNSWITTWFGSQISFSDTSWFHLLQDWMTDEYWSELVYLSFFANVLLDGTMVFDHGRPWLTMVVHGQRRQIMVERGNFCPSSQQMVLIPDSILM